MKQTFTLAGEPVTLDVEPAGAGWRVHIGGETLDVTARALPDGSFAFDVGGRIFRAYHAASGNDRWLAVGAERIVATRSASARKRVDDHHSGELTSPMPGQILAVKVQVGDRVKAGQTLLILEAMKMEYEIRAPRDGIVLSIGFPEKTMVTAGAALVDLGEIGAVDEELA